MAIAFLRKEVDLIGTSELIPLTMVVWGHVLSSATPLRPQLRRDAAANATEWLTFNSAAFRTKRAAFDRASSTHPDVLLFRAASTLLRRRASALGISHKEVAEYHKRLDEAIETGSAFRRDRPPEKLPPCSFGEARR